SRTAPERGSPQTVPIARHRGRSHGIERDRTAQRSCTAGRRGAARGGAGARGRGDQHEQPEKQQPKESLMTDQQLTDKTGAAVTVALDEDRRAYAIALADGEVAGRAYFTTASSAEDDWIFFHTEVDESYGGRGLGGLLVGEAVADAARRGK